MHVCNIGLAICTPHPMVPGPTGPRLSPVTVQWHRARSNLALPTNINQVQLYLDGMEVGDARNKAVETVLGMENQPEFLCFLDHDVIAPHDFITKLLYRARHFPDHGVFAGVYCLKSQPAEPLIYKEWGAGPFWDWTVGDLLIDGVVGVHMGLTLIRTSLLRRMADAQPWFKTTNETHVKNNGVHTNRGTEDLYFCKKAVEEFGAQILVDTSVLAGHQDIRTGTIYGLPNDSKPVLGARWMDRSQEYADEKKALDLGAGATRRQWDGHRTYTTDIRPDVGADYVQDTRMLNLLDDSFDLVASSHHLEHIPRWEQEEVWREIYRVTKPGGRIEHTVPSLDWAGAKLAAGETDEHVFNVLYGAQEQHGYRREFNLHYFGYSKDVAKSLAEAAGFVNVTCEDWRENSDLGYNLVIRGDKIGDLHG